MPKCPFCIFGYSSAMVLCSGARVYDQPASYFQFLPVVIVAAVAGSILWNYKGYRSRQALGLTFAGGIILFCAQFNDGGILLYYAGTVLVFLGVFLNGPFPWFWKTVKQKFLRL